MQPVGGRIPFYKLGAYKSRKFFRINKFLRCDRPSVDLDFFFAETS